MKQAILAKKIRTGPSGWAVFVDGVNRSAPGNGGLRRKDAHRIALRLREERAKLRADNA